MGSRRGSFGWCRELVIGTNIQRKRGEVILIHPSAAPTSCIFRPIERVLGSNPAWLYANRRILRHGLSNESSRSLNTLHVRRRCFSNLQTKYPPSSSPSHATNELIPPLPTIHRIRSLRKVEPSVYISIFTQVLHIWNHNLRLFLQLGHKHPVVQSPQNLDPIGFAVPKMPGSKLHLHLLPGVRIIEPSGKRMKVLLYRLPTVIVHLCGILTVPAIHLQDNLGELR